MNQQLELVLQARLFQVVQGFSVWEGSSCATFHAASMGDLAPI